MHHRHLRTVFALVAALAMVALLTGCGGAASGSAPAEKTPAALDGQAIMNEKCTACHDLARIESAKKTPTEWEDTIGRMEANGLVVTPEEKSAVLDYLSATYK